MAGNAVIMGIDDYWVARSSRAMTTVMDESPPVAAIPIKLLSVQFTK
jgi:hypothetical protein